LAVSALERERTQLANQLLGILNGTNSNGAKVDAVIVLGRYRITEAVPSLMQHLELDDINPRPSGWQNRGPGIETFEATPVSDALWRIGTASIPFLLDKLAESEDTNVISKCVRVCYRIEGRTMTQVRLQQLKDLATDQKMKARLEFAIGTVLGYDPSYNFVGYPDRLPQIADTLAPWAAVNIAEVQGRVLTRLQLEALLAKETDPARKARIQSALDLLAKQNATKK
jgi:hypothetical protein